MSLFDADHMAVALSKLKNLSFFSPKPARICVLLQFAQLPLRISIKDDRMNVTLSAHRLRVFPAPLQPLRSREQYSSSPVSEN
jgi:hypothetical protein